MRLKRQLRTATAALSLTIIGLASCKQKDDPVTPAPVNTAGSLGMQFSNMAGSQPLNLGLTRYVNAAGDSFYVSVYKYYISNIVLHCADGSTFAEPESYHLIDQSNANSLRFKLNDVPAADYDGVTFMIGVDSARNTSGAQTGALDESNGMFWTWNTGYIMAKMEGTANTSPNPGGSFFMHIADFEGNNNVLKTVTLVFPEPARVSRDHAPNVHLTSDILEWFKSPDRISIADYSNVMTAGEKAAKVAGNYADMFQADHVDN